MESPKNQENYGVSTTMHDMELTCDLSVTQD